MPQISTGTLRLAASVLRSTAQSIANNSLTDTERITFDTVTFDDASFWASSPNPTRLTVPVTGKYMVTAGITYAANTTGVRGCYVRVNGATYIIFNLAAATGSGTPNVSGMRHWSLTAGDYLELLAFQTSGGALNARANENWLAAVLL